MERKTVTFLIPENTQDELGGHKSTYIEHKVRATVYLRSQEPVEDAIGFKVLRSVEIHTYRKEVKSNILSIDGVIYKIDTPSTLYGRMNCIIRATETIGEGHQEDE